MQFKSIEFNFFPQRVKLSLLQWKTLQSLKPDPKAVNPEDEEAIEHAKNTIGDYKLKAALNLDDNVEKRPTVLSKYKQIINCRRKVMIHVLIHFVNFLCYNKIT